MSDSEQMEEEDYQEEENDAIEEEGSVEGGEEGQGDDTVKILKDDYDQITVNKDKGDPTCATYVFPDEDHTLGNALRFMLIKRSDVEFSGYNIPHPSENIMNLRLQCLERDSDDVLVEGLQDIVGLCDVIENKFDKAIAAFTKPSTRRG